ncbi:NUDIX domain-containing protein [Tepidimonas sp.]|uniref:NUDIX domain-containing protein n=1 Tax=Tepidimonas sp. TaxID=2002775 RepID=UPI0028CF4B2E|nr:NUDIX domain-containing protein [Tepidimonas sp.]MDT7929499.1 NUDIX domain-containing protein [Tepidimonas sp.]
MTIPAPKLCPRAAADAGPRASASVVLLRDAGAGLQVLLLRRHTDARVLGGVYVFPGGKVDADDAAPDWAPWLDRPPEALARDWAREIDIIPPQLMSLAQLARHASVASAWVEAAQRLTRLRWVNGRFEPEDGFEGWFR